MYIKASPQKFVETEGIEPPLAAPKSKKKIAASFLFRKHINTPCYHYTMSRFGLYIYYSHPETNRESFQNAEVEGIEPSSRVLETPILTIRPHLYNPQGEV